MATADRLLNQACQASGDPYGRPGAGRNCIGAPELKPDPEEATSNLYLQAHLMDINTWTARSSQNPPPALSCRLLANSFRVADPICRATPIPEGTVAPPNNTNAPAWGPALPGPTAATRSTHTCYRKPCLNTMDQHISETVGLLALGQAQHDHEPAVPLDQCRDRSLTAFSDHQVPFPRTGNTAISSVLGTVVDTDQANDPTTGAFTQRLYRFTLRTLGLQQDSRLGQLTLGQGVNLPIDGLVRHGATLSVR